MLEESKKEKGALIGVILTIFIWATLFIGIRFFKIEGGAIWFYLSIAIIINIGALLMIVPQNNRTINS